MEPYALSRRRLIALIGAVIAAAVLGIVLVRVMLASQAAPLAAETPVTTGPPLQEAANELDSPAVSSIDSASPTCFRPAAGTGACYIQWNYLYVTAAPGAYVISMTVTIDDRLRAYHSGFFQSSMYIPNEMTASGYGVTCGAPGSGGSPEWGSTYRYVVRARDTTGTAAANYGSVSCPADIVNIFLPLLRKE